MTIHDGAGLFEKIVQEGLADKCLRDFSFGDLKTLAALLCEHCDGTTMPSYLGNGTLRIPMDAPLKYQVWRRKLTAKEKYELFLEMGVSEEDVHFFMHQRSIDVALGRTDDMGRHLDSSSANEFLCNR